MQFSGIRHEPGIAMQTCFGACLDCLPAALLGDDIVQVGWHRATQKGKMVFAGPSFKLEAVRSCMMGLLANILGEECHWPVSLPSSASGIRELSEVQRACF